MCKRYVMMVGALCLILAVPANAAEWALSVDGDGNVQIQRDGAVLAHSSHVFWGADWDWAPVRGAARQGAPLTEDSALPIELNVPELDLVIDAEARVTAANQIKVTYTLNAERALPGIVGGGMQWNLQLDSHATPDSARAPQLLDDHRGWQWPVGDDRAVRIEFDQSIGRVYFEKGRRHVIRTMLVTEKLSAGEQTITMTVTLPEGGRIVPAASQRYGEVNKRQWFQDALPQDSAPVDLSFLNDPPAGKHGFVRAQGQQLVFEDGTPARFWGANIAASAIASDKRAIKHHARRLAMLGFNLVRVHHHDSTGWVSRTVIDQSAQTTQQLDEAVMDRLDWWIKCLKDEGVYVWLDLHVGRRVRAGDQIGAGFDEMADGNDAAAIKGFNYFNDRVEQLMKQFNEKYVNHVNPYTGNAYKDEPAIVGMLITNENDITHHFGNMMLPNKNHPHHNAIFERAARAFAEAHGLDANRTMQAWVPGASKIFLADHERAWHKRMIKHLRDTGVKTPLATTDMWGNMPIFGLPSLTAGGIIDVHSYGKAEFLSTNPRHESNFVTYMPMGQAPNRPVAISEWNVPYPGRDRFSAPVYVAAISALQSWDAPMLYNYSQHDVGARMGRAHKWSTFVDPAIMGTAPAAALLYRRGDVAPAREHYLLQFDRESLYMQSNLPEDMASLRTLVERSKITIGLPDVPELDWDEATEPTDEQRVLRDLNRDFIPEGQYHVESDTGQLKRDWRQGYQRIDTPRSQIVHGWIGDQTLRTADAQFDITTQKALVALSSLDGKPIARSDRILITAMARVVAAQGDRMPMLSEPVEGRVRITAPEGLQLQPIRPRERNPGAVALPYRDGRYTLELPVEGGTHWFILERAE